jgi:hypothetical protein
MGGLHMSKAAALEEMYVIYRAFRNYLADAESWGDYGVEELASSFRSFCQREPVGGMFLESVLEELLDRPAALTFVDLVNPNLARRNSHRVLKRSFN